MTLYARQQKRHRCITLSSKPAHRFLRRQVRWSGIPTSLRILQFIVIHTVKGFSVVNETEVYIFLEFPCFLYGPADIGNVISGSFAFSKPSLYIWKFSVHIPLKPSLKDFEHYLASLWNQSSCTVAWTVFGIDFLWDWNENLPFPVLWPVLSFPDLLTCWMWHFKNIIFLGFEIAHLEFHHL